MTCTHRDLAPWPFTFPWPNTLLIVPLLVLICASTYCLSLFLGSLVTRQPRIRNLVGSVSLIVARAFCGVSVPLSFWPDSVQLIVQFLPVTHGLQAIRLVLDEAAVGLGWLVVAIITMDRMANAGRADGSIEFV